MGKRKFRRPLRIEEYGHCVFKAEVSNLLWKKDEIEATIRRLSDRFTIHILDLAVHADHVHQIVKISDRQDYVKWSRAVPGVLSRKFGIKWKHRPFTKFVGDDPAYISYLVEYVDFNRREGEFILAAQRAVERWRELNFHS